MVADPYRVWCPKPGCETVVHLQSPRFLAASVSSKESLPPNPTVSAPRSRKLGTITNLYQPPSSQAPPNSGTNKEQALASHKLLSSSIIVENEILGEKLSHSQATLNNIPSTVSPESSTPKKVAPCFKPSSENPETSVPSQSDPSKPHKPTGLTLPLLSKHSTSSESSCDSSSDPIVLASLAGLQSPAEFRSFATISGEGSSDPLTLVQSPAEYRLMLGMAEAAGNIGTHAKCPACHTVFCPSCGEDSHPNKPCTSIDPLSQHQVGLRQLYKKLVSFFYFFLFIYYFFFLVSCLQSLDTNGYMFPLSKYFMAVCQVTILLYPILQIVYWDGIYYSCVWNRLL